jgi:PPE-repeat protein
VIKKRKISLKRRTRQQRQDKTGSSSSERGNKARVNMFRAMNHQRVNHNKGNVSIARKQVTRVLNFKRGKRLMSKSLIRGARSLKMIKQNGDQNHLRSIK